MKIVINKCYGGFSLSAKAVKRIAELQGKNCFFYYKNEKSYVEIPSIENIKSINYVWHAFTIKDEKKLNEFLKKENDWYKMTLKEKNQFNKKYKSICLESRPRDRTDKYLIQAVEELGKEANGDYAELKIIEIPDNIEYDIIDYDGIEHVAEKHKVWL